MIVLCSKVGETVLCGDYLFLYCADSLICILNKVILKSIN